MILLSKGASVPVAPLSKSRWQCPRHVHPFRRPRIVGVQVLLCIVLFQGCLASSAVRVVVARVGVKRIVAIAL